MCGDPGTIFPLFGSRYVEGTEEGDTVVYSCIRGMTLVDGDEVRTCLTSGEWSGTLPRCDGECVLHPMYPPPPLLYSSILLGQRSEVS